MLPRSRGWYWAPIDIGEGGILIETQRGADVTARLVAEKETSISFPVTGMACDVQQADNMYDEIVDLMYTHSR
jgi:hypothetical protein